MDYLKLIIDKETELKPLYDRMDKDAEVFNLKAYEMLGVGGKKVNKAYHITLPDPKQYLDDIVAKLSTVRRQVVVESSTLPGEKTSTIENWISDIQFECDALLAAKGEADAFTQHSDLVCSRGPIVEHILLREEDGELVADRRPLDSRYFSYELAKGKMVWGAPALRRSKADIEKEYGIVLSAKTGIVRDFYDNEAHCIYVGKEKVWEEENTYGEPPFVIAIPQTSSARRDENYYKNLGDSILRTLRTEDGHYLFEEKNYIASYLKTVSNEALFPPTQAPAPPEDEYQKLPDGVPGSGQMVQVKQPFVPFPKSELSQATALYIQEINEALRRGTRATLSHGIIDLPQSGVAIMQKVALQNESQLPRLNCLASLFQQSAKMSIRQFTKIGKTLEIGEEGHRRKYSPADLDGKYVIKYRFYTTSQEQMAGATAIANQVKDWISEETIQDEILMLQDPAGERAKMAQERSRKAIPALDLYEQMKGHIMAQEASEDDGVKDEHDLQAAFILERIISIIRQQRASEFEPVAANFEQSARVETKGAPGIPVFGGSQQQVKTP